MAAALLFVSLTVEAQVSYWFSQWQKKPDAQTAQEFFMVPGAGVTFTYATNHVIINANGTNFVISTNALYAGTATNWLGSNALYVLLSGMITNYVPGTNVTFAQTGPFTYEISSTGGSGTSCCQVVGFATNSMWAEYATNWLGSNAMWAMFTNYSSTNLTAGTNVWTGSNNFIGPVTVNGASICTAPCGSGTNTTFTSPTNIQNCALFLSYIDLTNGAVVGWTNQINPNLVFNAVGSMTKSSSGVYFDGVGANYLKTNGVTSAAVRWFTANDSVWIAFTPERVTDGLSYDCIIANDNPAGRILYAYNGNLVLNNLSSTLCALFTNIDYDVAMIPSGGNVTGYTNGTVALSPAYSESRWIWGLGHDADADANLKGHIRFVGIWTNYTLTLGDIWNLHNYSLAYNNAKTLEFVQKTGDSMTGPLIVTNTSPLICAYSILDEGSLSLYQYDSPTVQFIDCVNLLAANIAWNSTNGFEIKQPGGRVNISTNGIIYGNGLGLTNVPFTTSGLSITQYITDFLSGQITNVFSNGLLIASGTYVVPPSGLYLTDDLGKYITDDLGQRILVNP